MKRSKLFLLFVLSLSIQKLKAQEFNNALKNSDTSLYDQIVEKIGTNFNRPLDILENFQISGYYRFIANYRHLDETYAHLEKNKNNIFIGDDSQIPQLMLNISGNTSSRTSFGTDLFIWTPMTGAGEKENVKGLNLGISLYGNFSTSIGNFNVRTGGINWYSLSPFTFQTAKGNNRYSVFERNPWDPNTAKIESRYTDFYNSGAINQDQRWGNQAFQGLIVEGAQLPKNFSFSLMYGKTQFDGGLSAIPNTSYGGRIVKTSLKNQNFIALNTFNNESRLDSIKTNKAGFNMATIEANYFVNKIKLYTEIGLGRQFIADSKSNWGEAISFKVSTNIKKKYPTELHLYRISPNVFNNSSVFINSSIQQAVSSSTTLTQPVLIPVSSAVLPIGQLSNNRQGLELNTQINLGRLKNSIGYGNSMELNQLSNKLTYSHAFNNLALSRFWRWDFPSEVGPYKNLNKIYRSVFETVYLTETDAISGKPLYKKYFNTFELNSKYQTKLGSKDLFLFYLGNFSSVQNHASASVVFSEKALLRSYAHQFETYLKLNSRYVWTNYFGMERILANYQTVTDAVTRRPKNQKGFSIATGLDIQLSKGVGLYLRERWMKYEDMNFANDRYKGFETTVELKMFF